MKESLSYSTPVGKYLLILYICTRIIIILIGYIYNVIWCRGTPQQSRIKKCNIFSTLSFFFLKMIISQFGDRYFVYGIYIDIYDLFTRFVRSFVARVQRTLGSSARTIFPPSASLYARRMELRQVDKLKAYFKSYSRNETRKC